MILVDKDAANKDFVKISDEHKKEYASRAVGNTALGLSIGALGLQLLGSGRLFNPLFGNATTGEVAIANDVQYNERKGCQDVLDLTNFIWKQTVDAQAARFADREQLNSEFFGLYKSTRDGFDAIVAKHNEDAFGLYKNQRDNFDILNAKITALETQVAVNAAIRPYQDKLIQCEIEKAYTAGINYTDKKTCRMITGQVVLPSTPTVTGYGSYCCCPSTQSTTAGV